MSVHTLPDGRVICKWYDDAGKIKKKYFGRGELAEKKALALDRKIKELKAVDTTAGIVTIRDLLGAYHNQHLVTKSTQKSDFYRIDRTLVPALGHIAAEAIKSEQVNSYIMERVNAGKSLATVDREFDLLRAAYAWGMSQSPKLIHRNPLADFRLKQSPGKDVPLPPSIDEVRAIIAHARRHLIRAIMLSWHTGMRPGFETTGVKWADVNLDDMLLKVVSARKGGPAVRHLAIHPDLAAALSEWKTQDEALIDKKQWKLPISDIPIVNYGLRPVTSLKHAWDTAKRDAKITRRLRLYDIRHKFATQLLEEGTAGAIVSKLMGHSREDTTQRFYMHVSDHHTAQAIKSLPSLGTIGTEYSEKKKDKSNNSDGL